MPRLNLVVVAGVLGAVVGWAVPARADDLQVLVERTVAVGEPIPLTVLSDQPGNLVVSVFRQGDVEVLSRAEAGSRPGDGPGFPFRYETANRRQTFAVPAPLPGPYVLFVDKGGLRTSVTALVSDLALVTKRHPGGLLAWAVNRTTGAPWQGAEVVLRAGAVEIARGATDARGLARFDRTLPPTVTVKAGAGEHVALGDETWFPAGSEDLRVYAFPSQPAYRPGERVEVKGVVRGVVGGGYVLPQGVTSVRLQFAGPGSEGIVPEVEVPLSPDLGTFSGGFDLPADARTGDWRLVARVERPGAGVKEYEAPFVVEAYRKPSLEVLVTPKAPRILAGETATFDVAASFYDGGPVANAAATWSLVWNRVDRDLFPTSELVRLFFATEREAYKPEPLATGEGKTGADGKLTVTGVAPAGRPDGYLALQVVVVGPDRLAVAGGGSVAVSSAPIAVGLRTDRHLYGPEDVARVTVKVETADGKPAASRPGVLLVGTTAEGERAEKILATLPFTTDADGLARLDAPLGMSARYLLSVAVDRLPSEPKGPPAAASLHVWAVGENATIGYAGERLEVVADREDYAVGDRARLLVLSPKASQPMLAALEGATLLGVEVLSPQGNAALWTVEIREEHVPNVFAAFAAIDHGNLLSASRMLRIPPATRRLVATIEPDAADVKPGAASGATVKVVDAGGAPVAGAEIALAVVDDALHALYPDPAAPLEAFFYPVRRNDVRTGGPLHHVSTGFALAPQRKNRERPLADGATGAEPAPNYGPSSPAPAPSTAAPARAPAGDAGPSSGGIGAPAPAEREAAEGGEELASESKKSKEDGGGDGPTATRADFRTSVYWTPTLRTDADGKARVPEIRYADALTRWRLTARVVDATTRVGTSVATVRARLPVSVRVTAPRFLRGGDAATVPLVVRNLTETDAAVALRFRKQVGDRTFEETSEVAVAAGATITQHRGIDGDKPGTLLVEAGVESQAGSDAERREIPVLPQGIEKVVGRQVSLAAGTTSLSLEVPKRAEPGTVTCRLSVEPAYVQAALAALPYLAGYPYGCTEQTMSRFVPVVAAVEALDGLGIPRRGLAAELDKMVAAGVGRLEALRHEDGGFGWWPNDASDPGMTAIVVRGLNRVLRLSPEQAAAKALRDGAATWLAGVLSNVKDMPTLASVLLALAEADRAPREVFGTSVDAALAPEVSPLSKALYLQAAVAARHDVADVRALADQLVAAAVKKDGTAHWAPSRDPEGGITPTRWQEDPVETTAEVLRALLVADAPAHAALLAEGARWLAAARGGDDHWHSTRDTAAAVAFLAAYAAKTGDLGAGKTVEVSLNGKPLATVAVTKENLFTDAAVVVVPPAFLAPGAALAFDFVASTGSATVSAALRFHESGPAIAAADAGFRVERRWWRLDPKAEGDRVTWTRTPVTETVPTGTLLEVEVLVTTPREREFAMVLDPHVAGFEPARETAMDVPGRAPAAEATTEGYDDRTVFFATHLPAGTSTFRHLVRATHVGRYTALPAQASLMYFPDVRGNGNGEAFEIAAEGSPAGRGEEGGAR